MQFSLGRGQPGKALKVFAGGKTSMGPPSALWHGADGSHDEQIHGEEMGEKEKQNGSCAVDRGSEE